MINFIPLEKEEMITTIISQSFLSDIKAVAVFKHSTRCGISQMALSRLQRNWDKEPGLVPAYYLDLLSYRDLSAKIAEVFKITHQSPQLLFIKNGICIGDLSHNAITIDNINEILS